jgi:DegV family protein with EDD domain
MKGRFQMKKKIVADSSANLLTLHGVSFSAAPLKIITDDREFVDDAALDVAKMVKWFGSYQGRSQTSCPNSGDWLEAFGDGDEIYCVTITSGLSGSYHAACIAKQMYEEKHPGKRVCVIDSLSAGPELVLLIEKLQELIAQGLPYEQICERIEAYKQQTGVVFMLASLKNFAANGRVSPAVARLAGVLGIRIVGKAGDRGTLEPTDKCRGEAKSLTTLLKNLKAAGLCRGKVQIAHCENEAAAEKLKRMLRQECPQVTVHIHSCRGLCSYYAEKGGLLVGFEKM